MSMNVQLEAPSAAPTAARDPGSDLYDVTYYDVRLTFTNAGPEALSFPGEDLVNRVQRSYRNLETGSEQIFVQGSPPSETPRPIHLQPGESWSYGLGLEYPADVLPPAGRYVPFQLCVSWDKASLDATVYPPGSYDWAESFRICHDIRLEAPAGPPSR